MIFFDTNVLIYSSVNQDIDKQKTSDQFIQKAIRESQFIISPLILIEYVFVLSKLRQLQVQERNIQFFKSFSLHTIDTKLVSDAFELMIKLDSQNINDLVHLKFAEKYCSRLFTFDKDFQKLQKYTELEIKILK